ncbi:DUF421 domain-containing protein [Reyranella sp.]|uniref:DUF421 domain-containing protein n=1 Tax=Reyranella sp. TaxID=1929291 RepID=UPI004035B19A
MFFSDWADLGRIVAVGTLAYAALIVFLRLSGKRTLTKLNAFDLVVTVALGSTLSSVLLDKSITLAEGALAFGLLVLLQYILTWSSVRWRPFEKAVKSEPTLLLHRGEFLSEAMRRQRITESEVLSAVRSSGKGDVRGIRAVVLENDGSLSVIPESSNEGGVTLI